MLIICFIISFKVLLLCISATKEKENKKHPFAFISNLIKFYEKK